MPRNQFLKVARFSLLCLLVLGLFISIWHINPVEVKADANRYLVAAEKAASNYMSKGVDSTTGLFWSNVNFTTGANPVVGGLQNFAEEERLYASLELLWNLTGNSTYFNYGQHAVSGLLNYAMDSNGTTSLLPSGDGDAGYNITSGVRYPPRYVAGQGWVSGGQSGFTENDVPFAPLYDLVSNSDKPKLLNLANAYLNYHTTSAGEVYDKVNMTTGAGGYHNHGLAVMAVSEFLVEVWLKTANTTFLDRAKKIWWKHSQNATETNTGQGSTGLFFGASDYQVPPHKWWQEIYDWSFARGLGWILQYSNDTQFFNISSLHANGLLTQSLNRNETWHFAHPIDANTGNWSSNWYYPAGTKMAAFEEDYQLHLFAELYRLTGNTSYLNPLYYNPYLQIWTSIVNFPTHDVPSSIEANLAAYWATGNSTFLDRAKGTGNTLDNWGGNRTYPYWFYGGLEGSPGSTYVTMDNHWSSVYALALLANATMPPPIPPTRTYRIGIAVAGSQLTNFGDLHGVDCSFTYAGGQNWYDYVVHNSSSKVSVIHIDEAMPPWGIFSYQGFKLFVKGVLDKMEADWNASGETVKLFLTLPSITGLDYTYQGDLEDLLWAIGPALGKTTARKGLVGIGIRGEYMSWGEQTPPTNYSQAKALFDPLINMTHKYGYLWGGTGLGGWLGETMSAADVNMTMGDFDWYFQDIWIPYRTGIDDQAGLNATQNNFRNTLLGLPSNSNVVGVYAYLENTPRGAQDGVTPWYLTNQTFEYLFRGLDEVWASRPLLLKYGVAIPFSQYTYQDSTQGQPSNTLNWIFSNPNLADNHTLRTSDFPSTRENYSTISVSNPFTAGYPTSVFSQAAYAPTAPPPDACPKGQKLILGAYTQRLIDGVGLTGENISWYAEDPINKSLIWLGNGTASGGWVNAAKLPNITPPEYGVYGKFNFMAKYLGNNATNLLPSSGGAAWEHYLYIENGSYITQNTINLDTGQPLNLLQSDIDEEAYKSIVWWLRDGNATGVMDGIGDKGQTPPYSSWKPVNSSNAYPDSATFTQFSFQIAVPTPFMTNGTNYYISRVWDDLNYNYTLIPKMLENDSGAYREYGHMTGINFTASANRTLYFGYSAAPVTITIISPTNTTYPTSNINVTLSASGGTINYTGFNCKNGTNWIYLSNQTYTVSVNMTGFTNGVQYTFYVWATNTAGSSAEKTVMFSVALSDYPPTYSNVAYNTSIAGMPCQFSSYWTDDKGLSGYIFSSNNTGSWQNQSGTVFIGNPSWANKTLTLNATAGNVIQYRWYANDTSNQWNATSIFSLTITGIGENIVVLLGTPGDGATSKVHNVIFTFTPIFYQTIQNASLWIDGVSVIWNISAVVNNTVNSINYTFLTSGSKNWNIGVYNSTHLVFAAANRTLTLEVNPTYNNPGITMTLNGTLATFYCTWFDDYGMKYGVLEINVTGMLINQTMQALSGTIVAFIDNATLPNVGDVVAYRFYASDQADNWNATSTYYFTVTASSPYVPRSTYTPSGYDAFFAALLFGSGAWIGFILIIILAVGFVLKWPVSAVIFLPVIVIMAIQYLSYGLGWQFILDILIAVFIIIYIVLKRR